MLKKVLRNLEHLAAFAALIIFFTLIGANNANAQSVWDQCTDGRSITRCETYDCPNGDTNSDGNCNFDDQGARLTDVRNDSFCSNPISGCGEVRYFASGDNDSCSVRVEQNDNNCDLYNVAEPTFTPRPTPTPVPTNNHASEDLTCSNLLVTPPVGSSPLDVEFEIKATGEVNNIEEYEFAFRKPNGSTTGSVTQASPKLSQEFSEEGTHRVIATIITKSGDRITSASCSKTVSVNQRGVGGGADTTESTDEKLPETGSPLLVGAFFVMFGITGVYIYEKYKFI